MSEPAKASSLPAASFEPSTQSESAQGLVGRYRLDHRNPVNHFLHVAVGWPMVGISIFLLPFRPLWAAALFVSGYAFMFTGHFVFEKNIPTIFKDPSTPFVIAWAVTGDLCRGLARLVKQGRGR